MHGMIARLPRLNSSGDELRAPPRPQRHDELPDARPSIKPRDELKDPMRIMLVEDHVLVRQALKNLLEADGSVHVICQSSSWQDAVHYQEDEPCDLVLMDIALEGGSGIEGIAEMRRRWPDLLILAISGHLDSETVIGALEAGASGYIAKSASRDELLNALRVVAGGGGYLDPYFTSVLLGQLRTRSSTGRETQALALTARERQIMELVAEGVANREIAERLFLTESTVKSYLRTLYRRLNVSDRAQAVAYVIRAGLIAAPPRGPERQGR